MPKKKQKTHTQSHFSCYAIFFVSQNGTKPNATEGCFFFSMLLEAAAEHPVGASPHPSPPFPRLSSATSVAGPCGLTGATQPGPHVSPPTQLPTPESKPSGAEVCRRHTLERVTARGEGNTWPGANLLCTHSLSAPAHSLIQSITQSLLCALPPTYSLCSSLSFPDLHFFF